MGKCIQKWREYHDVLVPLSSYDYAVHDEEIERGERV